MDRAMPAEDFYRDFATAHFGAGIGREAGGILAAADGFTIPFTKEREYAGSSCWGIRSVNEPWEEMKGHYRFVEQFAALRPRVSGAGNLERFDYWLNTFRASEMMMRIACERGALEAAMKAIAAEKDPAVGKRLAEAALLQRLGLARQHEELMRLQITTVSTPGELGTIAALEQHGSVWRQWLPQHDAALTTALGRPLPPEAQPTRAYTGKPLLTLLTRRGKAHKGEQLDLRIIALDKQPVKSVSVHIRPLGHGNWQTIEAKHVARAVYEAKLPVAQDDFEYNVEAFTGAGQKIVWPRTAPTLNQTVIVTE
jgi:hypothetical protein